MKHKIRDDAFDAGALNLADLPFNAYYPVPVSVPVPPIPPKPRPSAQNTGGGILYPRKRPDWLDRDDDSWKDQWDERFVPKQWPHPEYDPVTFEAIPSTESDDEEEILIALGIL